jgi:hypothetical protein
MAKKQTTGHARSGRNRNRFTTTGDGMISMNLKWRVTPTQMAQSYAGWWEYTKHRMNVRLDQIGADGVVWMKHAHPWRNRTSKAEEKLDYEIRQDGDRFTIVFHHGMPYGRFLEERWGGKWGVLPATVDTFGPQAMQAMQEILR